MQGTPALSSGTRFGGDFTILRQIGAGGMASVHEAREEPLGRIVALKILAADAGESLRARFLAEARTMAALRHPNIVEVHRYGTDEASGLPFLAMDRFPGSLADRLTDCRVLPEEE
ncbi:MAG: protein kinase, partial [Kiritimatiellae bacterium]|nr:protein kinase [Kiritimatiellia bacterium]